MPPTAIVSISSTALIWLSGIACLLWPKLRLQSTALAHFVLLSIWLYVGHRLLLCDIAHFGTAGDNYFAIVFVRTPGTAADVPLLCVIN